MKIRNLLGFRAFGQNFIQLGRWLLLVVFLVVGLLLLLGGKNIGFSILFLLVVLWLILDNPLEYFTTQGDHDSSDANWPGDAGEGPLAGFAPREPVVLGSSDTLDLHTFSPKEVPSLLEEFIHESQRAEIYLVKIIHGKGSGTMRRRVQTLLARNQRVLAFYDAPPESGGWGATLVELRPDKEPEGEVFQPGTKQ
ncbi:MAG: Smr/MutS family protein [Deltaproteobacteria bacterium]